MIETGERLETVRITNAPDYLREVMTRAGEAPEVVLEACYGWYWAADTLAELTTPADHTAIRGSRGSPGKASGPAHVLQSLADARRLQPRDVLVVDTTAPPWTPLFATAAAVVSDTVAFSATARWSPASTASRPSSAPGTRLHGSPTAN
jgi:hypothetical protein